MKATVRDKSHKLPTVFELVLPAFETLRVNATLYLILFILPAILTSLLTETSAQSPETLADIQNSLSSAGMVIPLAASIVLLPYMALLQIKGARGEKLSAKELVTMGSRKLPKLLALYIILAIIIGAGLMLFIIPGLILLKRYMLSPYYLIDDDCSIAQAMRSARNDVRPFSNSIWSVIGFGIVVYLAFAISIVVPILALLYIATQIAWSFMPALRYHQIREELGWSFDLVAIPPSK